MVVPTICTSGLAVWEPNAHSNLISELRGLRAEFAASQERLEPPPLHPPDAGQDEGPGTAVAPAGPGGPLMPGSPAVRASAGGPRHMPPSRSRESPAAPVLVFRFDVDTHRCIREGVPNLLGLARDGAYLAGRAAFSGVCRERARRAALCGGQGSGWTRSLASHGDAAPDLGDRRRFRLCSVRSFRPLWRPWTWRADGGRSCPVACGT